MNDVHCKLHLQCHSHKFDGLFTKIYSHNDQQSMANEYIHACGQKYLLWNKVIYI